jgi:preprotein translocase SecF subunit
VGKGGDQPEFIVRVLGKTNDSTEDQKAVLAALERAFNAGWVQESSVASEVGSRMTIRYGGDDKSIAEIESVLAGIQDIRVSPALDEKTFYVQFASLDQAMIDQLEAQLTGKSFKVLSNETVGPKVGGDLKTQGFVALALTLGLILVYVAFRFDLAFAPGAVLSLFHDVWIVIGVFVLFRKEFNVQMIGALLTIIGYSLNDTIVIYDRIRENMRRYRRKDLMLLINDSINETLGRTISTSITTLLAMLPFLVFGGPVIRDFAIAMVIGIFAGCYSTIYVAAPMILLMEDLKPVLGRWIAPFSLAPAGEKKDGSGVAS